MSAFDHKQVSEQDAFRLDEAKKEQSRDFRDDTPAEAAQKLFEPQASPVAKVVEQIMAHWADADEGWASVARASGDPSLQKLAGQAQHGDPRPFEGMTGDFKADSEGPSGAMDAPPLAGADDLFGHAGGEAGSATDESWTDVYAADAMPFAAPEVAAEPVHGGGGGGGGSGGGAGGEDENPLTPPPGDPGKPKKPKRPKKP